MKKTIWLFNHHATGMLENKSGRHYWFAENLQANGYAPTVFCSNICHFSNKSIDLGKSKIKIENKDKIPFVFVKSTPYKGNGLSRIRNMYSFYRNLFYAAKEYIKQSGKPDIILASSVHPLTMVAGIKIARKLKIPCICEIRDLWPEAIFFVSKRVTEKSIIGKILVNREYWIYRNADAMIFVKEGDIAYLAEHKWDTPQGGKIDPAKCYYINNGINYARYRESINSVTLSDDDLEDDTFKAVYCGAIRPVNNVEQILDCAAILKNEKDIKFLIYGDGDLLGRLRDRAGKDNMDNVRLKGFVERKYVPYILSKSSLNILNYSAEKYNWARGSSSNKLFEYMASGKPILSTVKMGYCILEKYNCGLSLDECTPQAMADAILKIKNMPKEEYERLGRNAQNGAKDFDFAKHTAKLIEVVESVT